MHLWLQFAIIFLTAGGRFEKTIFLNNFSTLQLPSHCLNAALAICFCHCWHWICCTTTTTSASPSTSNSTSLLLLQLFGYQGTLLPPQPSCYQELFFVGLFFRLFYPSIPKSCSECGRWHCGPVTAPKKLLVVVPPPFPGVHLRDSIGPEAPDAALSSWQLAPQATFCLDYQGHSLPWPSTPLAPGGSKWFVIAAPQSSGYCSWSFSFRLIPLPLDFSWWKYFWGGLMHHLASCSSGHSLGFGCRVLCGPLFSLGTWLPQKYFFIDCCMPKYFFGNVAVMAPCSSGHSPGPLAPGSSLCFCIQVVKHNLWWIVASLSSYKQHFPVLQAQPFAPPVLC